MYPGQATGGAFGTRVQIGSGWAPYRDLVIGKVNRDQYDDLLTVNNDDGRLMLYTGNAAGGNFNAVTGVNDTVTWNLSSAVIGGKVDDSGLDGLLEVETATGRTWLHTRTATGGWNARIAPAGTIQGPGPEEMSDLVSGEFTRDGSTDLIGTDSAGYLWLYPGTAAKTFGTRRLIGFGLAELPRADHRPGQPGRLRRPGDDRDRDREALDVPGHGRRLQPRHPGCRSGPAGRRTATSRSARSTGTSTTTC